MVNNNYLESYKIQIVSRMMSGESHNKVAKELGIAKSTLQGWKCIYTQMIAHEFQNGDLALDVNVSPSEETVQLTQKQLSLLFGVAVDNISLHIKNILNDGGLDNSVVEESSVTASDGKIYKTKIYNLDMILAVRYRVKSKNATTALVKRNVVHLAN